MLQRRSILSRALNLSLTKCELGAEMNGALSQPLGSAGLSVQQPFSMAKTVLKGLDLRGVQRRSLLRLTPDACRLVVGRPHTLLPFGVLLPGTVPKGKKLTVELSGFGLQRRNFTLSSTKPSRELLRLTNRLHPA